MFSASRKPRSPLGHPAPLTHGTRSIWLMLAASLWIATVGNIALWRTLYELPSVNQLRGLLFSIGFGVIITAATLLLLSLFNWRRTLKPAMALFLVSAAAGMYFMLTYGVVIDPSMMVNAVQTDYRETRDLLTIKFAFTLLFVGILPALLLWRLPVRQTHMLRRLGGNIATFIVALLVVAGTLLLVYQDFSSLMRNNTQVRYLINPLNSFYALARLGIKSKQLTAQPLQAIGQDARVLPPGDPQAKPQLLLLVLGEAARSGNLGLNGYERATTPGLSSLASQAGENLVSWRNAWSCGTSTAASVPCMFSGLGKTEFESRTGNYEGLLDVLQRSGLAVLWLDDQSGCKGVCDRIPNFNTRAMSNEPEFCPKGECFDEIMLAQLPKRLAELPPERRAKGVVVVFHQMGSHGPAYYKRSPVAQKKYLPECTNSSLPECTREQIVNAYDNSILYADRLLTRTVEWLKAEQKQYATAMMYVGDHGQSLGENNLYLHGLPYSIAPDVQKRVPWITWMSPTFVQSRQISTSCLRNGTNNRITHDNYFHSVLGLMDVQTSVYKPDLDMFKDCTGSTLAQSPSDKADVPAALGTQAVVAK